MLNLIRVGAGYTGIDADASRIDEAKNLGLIETIPANKYNSIKQNLNSLEIELSEASTLKIDADKELRNTDKKLSSIVYNWFPFTLIDSFYKDKTDLILNRRFLEVQCQKRTNEFNALEKQVSSIKDTIKNYVTLNDVCIKSTAKGLTLLPEAIAREVDKGWSHNSQATYMIAVNLAGGDRNKFLEAAKLARLLDNNWSHESHSIYTIAAVICDNENSLLSRCAKYAMEADNNWSHESHALYTVAAAFTNGQKQSFARALKYAEEYDRNWSHESHAIYTIATALCNNDSSRIKKAADQAAKQDNNWSHKSHAMYMVAAALNDVSDTVFENASQVALKFDNNWSHESHAVYLGALAVSGFDTNRYSKAINLASALDKGWSHESHALYSIAAMCENDDVLKRILTK